MVSVIHRNGFGLASLLCGLAPSIELLIAFRVIQGAAGALLVPGSLSLLRVNFEGEEQGRAYGLWAAGTSLMVLAGPFLGGLLGPEIHYSNGVGLYGGRPALDGVMAEREAVRTQKSPPTYHILMLHPVVTKAVDAR